MYSIKIKYYVGSKYFTFTSAVLIFHLYPVVVIFSDICSADPGSLWCIFKCKVSICCHRETTKEIKPKIMIKICQICLYKIDTSYILNLRSVFGNDHLWAWVFRQLPGNSMTFIHYFNRGSTLHKCSVTFVFIPVSKDVAVVQNTN